MKKFLISLLILFCMIPCALAHEADGKQAWIQNPEGVTAVHGSPIDYERPIGLYLNGTPVTVKSVSIGDGPYGAFARVTMGEIGQGGAEFLVPLMYLSFEEVPEVQGVFQKGNPYYGDNHPASKRLGHFDPNTHMVFYGMYDEWCHVKIGDQLAFTYYELIQMDSDLQRILEVSQPKCYTPTTQKRLGLRWAHMDEQHRLVKERGGYEKLTLEDMAALSQMELAIGEDYVYGVNLLPGEGDISKEKAIEIARKAFMDTCQVEAEYVDEFTVSELFYELPSQTPGIRQWKIIFNKKGDGWYNFYATVNSTTGEVLETSDPSWAVPAKESATAQYEVDPDYAKHEAVYSYLEGKYGPAMGWSIEVWAELAETSPLESWHTLPVEGELTQEQALEKAFEYILAQYTVPEGEFDEYVTRFNFLEREGRRYWIVFIYPGTEIDTSRNNYYCVELDSKTGDLLTEIVLPGTTNG